MSDWDVILDHEAELSEKDVDIERLNKVVMNYRASTDAPEYIAAILSRLARAEELLRRAEWALCCVADEMESTTTKRPASFWRNESAEIGKFLSPKPGESGAKQPICNCRTVDSDESEAKDG